MYKISVILPVFNVEDYLNLCLSSLMKQTIGFENLEVIFVDDCSTDNSYEIIKIFSNKFENVKAYQTPENSGGGGKPRNIGLEHATAPYIMYLDPDDTYFDDACEVLYTNIINTNADLVSGNYLEYKDGEIIKPMDYKLSFGLKGNYLEINSVKECPQILSMIPAMWAKIYNRKFLIENNFKLIEGNVAEDLYFVVQCLLKAKKIVYVDVPIVKYMIRESGEKSKSTTAIKTSKTLFGYIYVYNKLYELIYEYDKDLAWLASVHLHFGTRQMILSHSSRIDTIAFLYNSDELYENYLQYYQPLPGFEIICDLIGNQQFYAVCDVAEVMQEDFMEEEYLLERMHDNEVIILYDNLDDLSENGKNIFKMINSLSNENFSVSVINIDNDENVNIIDNCSLLNMEKYFSTYDLSNKIQFINPFEHNTSDLNEKAASSNKNVVSNFKITDDHIIVKDVAINGRIKCDFYNIDEFSNDEIKQINQLKYGGDDFTEILSSKSIVKSEKINDNLLKVESIYNEKYNLEHVYLSNGEEHLTLLKCRDANSSNITLFGDIGGFNLTFESKKEFIQYFLSKYCLQFEKRPFVINMSSSNDIINIISTLCYEVINFENYLDGGWSGILKNSYVYSKSNEIRLKCVRNQETTKIKYDNELNNKNAELKKLDSEINDIKVRIGELEEECKNQSIQIEQQKKVIHVDNEEKINSLNEEYQEQIIQFEQLNGMINDEETLLSGDYNGGYSLNNISESSNSSLHAEKIESLSNLKASKEYYSKYRHKLLLPYLYIIFKHKNVIENIKLYRKIINGDWFDLGYYLNSNPDLSKRKWCKILNPETHYVCHGFDERRLPHPNYKNKLTKKDIILKK